jgi:hypothetical protein
MKQVLISGETDNSIIVNLESNTILPGSYVSADYNVPDDYKLLQLEQIANKVTSLESNLIKNTNTNYLTNTKIVSTYEDVIEHFTPSSTKYFVTGVTDSKADLISKYFKKSDFLKTTETLKPTQKLEYKKIVGGENNEIVVQEESLAKNNIIRTRVKLDVPGLDIFAMILSETEAGILEYVLYLETENPIKYIDLGDGLCTFMYMRTHNDTEITANMVLYDGIIEEPKVISEVFIERGLNSAFERMKKLKNIKDINELTKTGLGYYKINTKGYNFKTR